MGRQGPNLRVAVSEQRPRNELSNVSPQIDSSTNSMKPAYSSGSFNAVPWQGASRQTTSNQILRAGNGSCSINSHANGAPSLTTPYSKFPEGPTHDARYGGANENIAVPGKHSLPQYEALIPNTPSHVVLSNEDRNA